MTKIFLYNTLNRQKEEFIPIKAGAVGFYTCGPTVYNFAHIGNLRTYLFEDLLKRTLEYNGLSVKHVMNITDVGHLTGDQDMGEDKMEKGAAAEGRSAWDIASYYTAAFKEDLAALNVLSPNVWCRATDNIAEQIAMIETLEKKGFTYKTNDGIYFDTSLVKDYNKLSHLQLDELKEGARVEKNEEKKNPTDFALWKFSPKDVKRQMEWSSPWGVGFPGWHIECSAMSLKFLGEQLDIHCGGADHINVHHTNEIAQSEATTGKKFFNYWIHGAFLNIAGGKKMAKSEGNFLTLNNTFVDKGIDPLVYRLAVLSVHYRKPMEYSDEIILNTEKSLEHMRHQVADLGLFVGEINIDFKNNFLAALNDDLNSAQALAVAQELLKSDLSKADKLATILDFDKVLALNLKQEIPASVIDLAEERLAARRNRDFAQSDKLRDAIAALGFIVKDSGDSYVLMKQ